MRSEERYAGTWSELMEECSDLEGRRTELEEELDEVKKKIAHLEEVLRHLAPLAGLTYHDTDLSGLGITAAVRVVMENSKERMSASDVRRALEGRGFDFSAISSPMSSIYKILSRLADDPDCPVKKERDGNATFYCWEKPEPAPAPDDYAQSAEISDDDIPF